MKKLLMLMVAVSILLFPMTVLAEEGYYSVGAKAGAEANATPNRGYFSVGYGSGGEADSSSLTFEWGSVSRGLEHNGLIAIGFGYIYNADNVPAGTLEYPVPHSNYTDLGTKQKGNEYTLFVKYGLELIESSGLFAFALAGITSYEEVDLAQSNVTGWYYEQSSREKLNGMLGGGLSFFPMNSPVMLSIEYDNRRGITGSVGLSF